MSAFRAVFWATVLAVALSFLRRETRLTPRALRRPSRAARRRARWSPPPPPAGIIVGIVTLTGLGLKIAGLIVALAGGAACS